MKKLLISLLLIVFLVGMIYRDGLCWDNKVTHKDLSYFAAQNSVLSRDKGDYLKKIGFDKELLEVLRWDGSSTIKVGYITDWLQEGAFNEDAGSDFQGLTGRARYNNHFHNPLRPWSTAGLSDLQDGESSILWAQDTVEQDGSVGGDWSWLKVRYCYYDALTAEEEIDRQAFFACTFEGLGYQMHLIQDMSVPAHTRNDAHPLDAFLGTNYKTLDPYFETWAKKNQGMLDSFALSPTFPEVSLDVSRNGLAPITQFTDSEQYGGSMPSTSLAWGLAEYTNSNFVSDDTIFTEDKEINDKHYFPYPRYGANSYEMYEVENSLATKRIYLRKKGDGEHIEHFTTAGSLLKFLDFDPVLQKSEFKLDPVVYRDYAEKLIPRAVGYSAALINYFFRGDIDMVPDDETGSGYVIANNTDEDMDGTFELWYDNKNDERAKSWSASLRLGAKRSGNNESTDITLSSPSDAKDPGKYMLVFRGKMGSEEDAVVGRMVRLGHPRAGLISPVFGSWTEIVIWIINDDSVQSYEARVPSGESIVRAAFDEGNVDIVRILSRKWTPEMTVWQLRILSFDDDTDQYVEVSSEELQRDTLLPPMKTMFSYSADSAFHDGLSCEASETKSGYVEEDYINSHPVSDFFVTQDGQVHYLKSEEKTYMLNLPFVDKYDWQETCASACSEYKTESQRYVSGSLDFPHCTRKYTYTNCNKSTSYDYEGFCQSEDVEAVQIRFLWGFEACDGSYSTSDSLSIWLYNTLDYDGKTISIANSKYDGSTTAWETKATGEPCLLLARDAGEENGYLSGRILSDRQFILDGTEDSPLIEPEGEVLNIVPHIVLRQSGGYSIIEIGKGGTFHNQTSILPIASDKPLLLNKEGNGFKLEYDKRMSMTLIRTGFDYDDNIQDFRATGAVAFYVNPYSMMMDAMVEYENNRR